MEQYNITELVAMQKEIKVTEAKLAALETEQDNLFAKREKLQKQLKETCAHPTITSGTEFFEGGYDHVSYTEHYIECTICGTKEIVKTVKGYFS